jgi:hypothetical protein
MSTLKVDTITDSSSGLTTTINGFTPQTSNMAGRNLIINGGFDVWQRGTSFSNVNNVYTADRMYVVAGGGTTGDNVTRQSFTVGQTDVPGEPTYYFRFTAGSTSSNKVVHHKIEDVRTGAGQTVTLSFWGKASTAYSSTIELGQNFGSGGSSQVVPAAQSYSLTTSWQKFTFNIVLPSISGKTIGTSSYLYIAFIRSLPASNVDIDIAQMKLEVGSVATPFEHRSYGEELALCQRYFRKVVDGADTATFMNFHAWSANECIGALNLGGPMRATPTMSVSSFGHFVMRSGGTDRTATSFTFAQASKSGFVRVETGSGGGLTTGRGAWLKADNASAYLYADAEL